MDRVLFTAVAAGLLAAACNSSAPKPVALGTPSTGVPVTTSPAATLEQNAGGYDPNAGYDPAQQQLPATDAALYPDDPGLLGGNTDPALAGGGTLPVAPITLPTTPSTPIPALGGGAAGGNALLTAALPLAINLLSGGGGGGASGLSSLTGLLGGLTGGGTPDINGLISSLGGAQNAGALLNLAGPLLQGGAQ